MSIVAPKHTFVHSIPIQRRLREIMDDKGGAFTISALSSRIGINRETFRKMLTGEREIYTFELEKIAKEMNLSAARILQEDIQTVVKELDNLLAGSFEFDQGWQLAEDFLSLAVGVTEKCEAHIYAGKVLFQSRKYELAHEHRLEAHRLANVLKDKYGESSWYEKTLRHLMTSFTVRKDYSNAYAMIKLAKKLLSDDPKRLGGIYFSLAMIAHDSGRLEEARDQLYESLHFYMKTSDTREIGKALHNVAFIEYKIKNYKKASELFQQAMPLLDSFNELRLYPVKDYVKVLYEMGDREQAIQLIEQSLQQSPSPILRTKFLLQRAIYLDHMESAVEVLEFDDDVADKYKLIACKILMDYHNRQGDSVGLMKYYVIAESITISDSNRFGEEDL